MRRDIRTLHIEFIKECEFVARLSPETIRGYKECFHIFIKLIPNCELQMINTQLMIEFFKRLEKRTRIIGRGTKVKGVKKSTIATYRNRLNRYFNWLVLKGHLKDNPFRHMEYPNVTYLDRKFLKKEHIEKIFTSVYLNIKWKNAFIKKRNLALLYILLCCGIRRGELLGLKSYDIDMDRRVITVRAETSKSKRDRVLPLNTTTIEVLIEYIKERQKVGCSTSFFFVSSNHDGGLSSSGLKHLINKINESSGVKFHVHQFRHTFAINLLNNGCDIVKLKNLLGHSDIRMTTVYLRCLPTGSMKADVELITFDNLI